MKTKDSILMLVDKSINAFGHMLGLTEEDKLKTTLSVTESAIQDAFNIDSKELSKKALSVMLAKNIFNLEQAQQLSSLLWTKAEVLLKLNRAQESLLHYQNTLLLLKWKAEQPVEAGRLERIKKIEELKLIIKSFKSLNKNNIS